MGEQPISRAKAPHLTVPLFLCCLGDDGPCCDVSRNWGAGGVSRPSSGRVSYLSLSDSFPTQRTLVGPGPGIVLGLHAEGGGPASSHLGGVSPGKGGRAAQGGSWMESWRSQAPRQSLKAPGEPRGDSIKASFQLTFWQ